MGTTDGYVWFNIWDPVVDPLVLTGSALSLATTFLVLVTFAIYRQEQRTFRHALVLNLALAEFINSLNGTISGVYFVITKELTPGTLCSTNGWIGQMSVQASDFSMFAIAVITFLTITEKVYMPGVSRTKKFLICLSIWIVPVTTATIATAMGAMMPAGANWCWISASRTDLRYGLTHAWRFAIIFSIIFIYIYVYYHTTRRFKSFATTSQSTDHYTMASHGRKGSTQKSPEEIIMEYRLQAVHKPVERQDRELRGRSWLRLSSQSMEAPLVARPQLAVLKKQSDLGCNETASGGGASGGDNTKTESLQRPGTSGTHTAPQAKRTEREVKRMLLMNAYPILYVLLWIPGLVNRLLQAAGAPPPSRVLDALQAASAFIGFANALTYGFNPHLKRRISTDLSYWWSQHRRG